MTSAPRRRPRSTFDPLLALEAAYAPRDSTAEWLRGIARAMRPLDRGLGLYAGIVELAARPPRLAAAVSEGAARLTAPSAVALLAAAPARVRGVLAPRETSVVHLRDRLDLLPRRLRDLGLRELARLGVHDVLGLFAHDGAGTVLHVGLPLASSRRVHGRTLAQLARVAAHLESALRLRAAGAHPRLGAAWAQPGGATPGRGPDLAPTVWRGVVEGRWSVVDRWDAGGRRYLLARRCAAGSPDPKALTPRESAVVAYLAAGHPEKLVAYELGVSPATVAAQFASARRKLGVRTRRELIDLWSSG